MRGSWVLALGGGVSLLCVGIATGVSACVSDSGGATQSPTGDVGQGCFPNGTCNPGLSCVLVGSSAQCQPAGDAAAAEGGAAACKVGVAPPAFPCTGANKVACYSEGSGMTCTADDVACTGADGGVSGGPHTCFSEKDCAIGDVCCLQDGANLETNVCPGSLDFLSSPSACGATLPTGSGKCAMGNGGSDRGDVVLCSTAAGCPKGQSCYPVRLNRPAALQGQLLGVCL